MKMYQGKNNEIRRVMRKFSLRVNRLVRVQYGPYTLGSVPEPNDLQEVTITKSIQRIMYQYYRDRTKQSNTLMSEAKQEKVSHDMKKAFRDRKKNKTEELDSELHSDDDSDGDGDELPSLNENVNVYPDSMPEIIERSEDNSDIGERKGSWRFRD